MLAHIEDVVVDKGAFPRSKGIGEMLITEVSFRTC